MTYFVDASFVVRSLLSESSAAAKALAGLSKKVRTGVVNISAPELLKFEVVNGFRYSLKNSEQITSACQNFLKLPLEFCPLEGREFLEILNLALQIKATVYDTSYHFAAKRAGGVLLTCDKEYFQKAKHLGGIRLIS